MSSVSEHSEFFQPELLGPQQMPRSMPAALWLKCLVSPAFAKDTKRPAGALSSSDRWQAIQTRPGHSASSASTGRSARSAWQPAPDARTVSPLPLCCATAERDEQGASGTAPGRAATCLRPPGRKGPPRRSPGGPSGRRAAGRLPGRRVRGRRQGSAG